MKDEDGISVPFRVAMEALAESIDQFFNEKERTTGFVLLFFPLGEGVRPCNMVSNTTDRKEIIRLLREQVSAFDKTGEVGAVDPRDLQ